MSGEATQEVAVRQLTELPQAAASGLVVRGERLYVVADDELLLGEYTLGGAPLRTLRLLAGELPEDAAARKQVKPDFEALVQVGERLLAVGSGSKGDARSVAVWLDVETGDATRVDLRPLYAELASHVSPLNVEGAVVLGDRLALLTRRTGNAGRNLLVLLDLETVLTSLRSSAPRLDSTALLAVVPVELGLLAGVPLGFTDGTSWDERTLLFTAAAEATDDPVYDGVCTGSVLGLLELHGTTATIHSLARLACDEKIEGLCVVERTACGDGAVRAELRLVADRDDPTRHAPLFAASVRVERGQLVW